MNDISPQSSEQSNGQSSVVTEQTMTQRAIEASDGSTAPEKSPMEEVISPTPRPIVYDADASQRIPAMIEHQGEMFEVAFVLDKQTDDAIAEYNKQCDVRLVQADQKETGERNALESIDKSFEAATWLFNDRALSAEGFATDGELPANWKDFIADEDKAAVVDDMYLAAQVIPLPIAKPGKRLSLNYRKEAAVSTIRLKALFEGNELILTHELNPATADQISTYKSIQKERLLVQGTRLGKGETRIPPKARKLGALYDALIANTTGYQGRVPLHHKTLVVHEHMSREVEAVRKN